jgi:hypothetical protein
MLSGFYYCLNFIVLYTYMQHDISQNFKYNPLFITKKALDIQ